jgi:hypothetical protein
MIDAVSSTSIEARRVIESPIDVIQRSARAMRLAPMVALTRGP